MKKKVLIISGGISKERLISLDTGLQVSRELKNNGYKVKISEPDNSLALKIKQFKPRVIFNALHGKDGEDGGAEVEEAPTGAVSVRQQDTLDADETDAPTAATENDSSRLAGFGQIFGKRNSLDRKGNRPPQKASMTGQTRAKDKESEEGSVDL